MKILKSVILIFITVCLISVYLYKKELIQFFNIKYLLSKDLDGRVIPHRVNYLNKLFFILKQGMRSLEMDIIFRDTGKYGYFEIGHDENDATGIKLDVFLNFLQRYEIKKIWLDLKNLQKENFNKVINEIERLDSIYHFKDFTIIETSYKGSDLKILHYKGFHTSYYLPTNKILKYLEENDEYKLKKEADQIKKQIFEQKLSAISFDLRLYSFVKQYLEPHIPENIVYHVWDSVRLYKFSAIDKLKKSVYFKDKRIKTIIVKIYYKRGHNYNLFSICRRIM